MADLRLLAEALRDNHATAAAGGLVQDLIRLVEVFGLHLLTLDIRQHSARHMEALAEIFQWAGICADYAQRTPAERLALLTAELQGTRPLVPTAIVPT